MKESRYICNGNCSDCRYALGSRFCNRTPEEGSFAHKADRILTNRWLGLPLLILILFAVFELSFTLGSYPQRWIDAAVDAASASLSGVLPPGWFSSCLSDGVLQGCGAVLSFLPNILILFVFLSILEDSGYMARAAFIMDRLMHRVGLHGNSFIPMLIGFGCNVPAIMAAGRSIANRKNRTLTMLMIPFMSCSARLPVYMLLTATFFPRYKALVMIGLYAAGILLSVLFALVMKHTRHFRNIKDAPFELPAFRVPPLRPFLLHVWDRTKDYLQKITTVILAASVIIWALGYFPLGDDGRRAAEDASYLAAVGKAMEPVMAPLGFDWKMNVCILTGLPAKEAIVSTLGILYGSSDSASLESALRAGGVFSPAVALAFMLFVLLYFPCVATLRTLRIEIGWKWAAFTAIHSLALAWIVAFAARILFGVLL